MHSFIAKPAKAQAAYLSQQKESLTRGTAVVLLDFAENYSFVVQDAVQGYYWDNSQATLHPLVAYYRKEDGNLGTISFCVVTGQWLSEAWCYSRGNLASQGLYTSAGLIKTLACEVAAEEVGQLSRDILDQWNRAILTLFLRSF